MSVSHSPFFTKRSRRSFIIAFGQVLVHRVADEAKVEESGRRDKRSPTSTRRHRAIKQAQSYAVYNFSLNDPPESDYRDLSGNRWHGLDHVVLWPFPMLYALQLPNQRRAPSHAEILDVALVRIGWRDNLAPSSAYGDLVPQGLSHNRTYKQQRDSSPDDT